MTGEAIRLSLLAVSVSCAVAAGSAVSRWRPLAAGRSGRSAGPPDRPAVRPRCRSRPCDLAAGLARRSAGVVRRLAGLAWRLAWRSAGVVRRLAGLAWRLAWRSAGVVRRLAGLAWRSAGWSAQCLRSVVLADPCPTATCGRPHDVHRPAWSARRMAPRVRRGRRQDREPGPRSACRQPRHGDQAPALPLELAPTRWGRRASVPSWNRCRCPPRSPTPARVAARSWSWPVRGRCLRSAVAGPR
jgi:hypothetical protein